MEMADLFDRTETRTGTRQSIMFACGASWASAKVASCRLYLALAQLAMLALPPRKDIAAHADAPTVVLPGTDADDLFLASEGFNYYQAGSA